MKPFKSIQKHCLAKPGAVEDEPWPGDIAWKVKGKIFAMGGQTGVTVKSTPERQAVLIMHPKISKAAYVGRFGWVRVEIENKEDLETALDLIDESYDLITSPKRPKKSPGKSR